MVTSAGTISSWPLVASLQRLTNSARLTPWGPRSRPTGDAGVALPAASSSFTFAIALRLCLAISYLLLPWLCNGVQATEGGTGTSPHAGAHPRRLHFGSEGIWTGR